MIVVDVVVLAILVTMVVVVGTIAVIILLTPTLGWQFLIIHVIIHRILLRFMNFLLIKNTFNIFPSSFLGGWTTTAITIRITTFSSSFAIAALGSGGHVVLGGDGGSTCSSG